MLATATPPANGKTEAPAPGIYEGIPFEEYKRWDAVNKSKLDYLVNASPLHLWHAEQHPEPETAAMRLGSALDTLLLDEPGTYEERYVIATQCAATLAKGGRCKNDGRTEHEGYEGQFFCGVHAPDARILSGRIVLKEEEDAYVKSMRKAILDNTPARKFIGSEGQNQLSIVWMDVETGLKCKARLDMFRPRWGMIGDLKTTDDASPEAFARSIAKFGYARQSAFYLDGAKAVQLGADLFGFLCAESSPPHATATYQIDQAAIDVGGSQIRKALRTYAHCKETGVWPGYDNQFPLISVPRWEIQRALAAEQR